jgi:hypothetical protein
MKKQQPLRLPMYNRAARRKQLIRHITGIPFEFPVPLTFTGFSLLIIIPFLMYKWVPAGDPLFKYVVAPFAAATIVSYLEPESISPWQWAYAHIRKRLRPARRVVNRPVPRKGWVKEYIYQTYVHQKGEKRK